MKRKFTATKSEEQLNKNSEWSLNTNYSDLRIFIENQAGEKIPIIVKAINTIFNLKTRIHNKTGITVEKQNLVINEKILDNEKTLEFYNLENNSIISLFIDTNHEEMRQIFVNHCGKNCTLSIKASDTIEMIKYQIMNKIRIPLEYQILKHSGRILDNKMTVSFYNIEKESTIFLSTRTIVKKFLFFSQSH